MEEGAGGWNQVDCLFGFSENSENIKLVLAV